MWKSIKKFFKWIADHTGISWILGKLGWQSTNQEEENLVMVPKQYTEEQAQERQNGTITFQKKLELMDATIQEKEQKLRDTSNQCISIGGEGLPELNSRTDKINDCSRTFAHERSKLCDNKEEKDSDVLKEQAEGEYIVINGIVIPEGAKLKFFPELSNFLSRASLERERLFCKVAPNSSFTQLITPEQVANNDRSC